MKSLARAVFVALALGMSPVVANAANVLSIGIGTSPNDATGDPLRTAMTKIMTAVNGVASCWFGTVAPSAPMNYQCWVNTTANPTLWNLWDGAAWVLIGSFDTSAHTFVIGTGAAGPGSFTTLSASGASTLQGISGTTLNLSSGLTGTTATLSGLLAGSSETLSSTLGVTGLLTGVNETLSGTLGVTGVLTGGAATFTTPATSSNSTSAATTAYVRSYLGDAAAAQGAIFNKSASTGWGTLAAGTSGQYLKTQGAAADPVWAAAVTSVATDACLSGGTITGTGTLSGNVTINAQTGTSYTVAVGDKCNLVTFNNSAQIAVTLPTFTTGWYVDLQNNKNSQLVTITAAANINGAGTFTLPAGYGIRVIYDGTTYQVYGFNPLKGRVLISSDTASASASLDESVDFSNAVYKHYDIVLTSILPATTQAALLIQVYSGSSWRTSGYVNGCGQTNVGAIAVCASASTAGIQLSYSGATAAGNATNSGTGYNCRLTMDAVDGAGVAPVSGDCSMPSGTNSPRVFVNGFWNTAAVVQGFRLNFNAGNITSGTMQVYGWN